jgi:GNAT superfamily N-acetyltransferase
MLSDPPSAPVLVIRKGSELDPDEVRQMTDSLQREFKIHTRPESFRDKVFFLAKDGSEIVAMGGLWHVYPFEFDDIKYDVYGVVEVIANRKGMGYGKQVMTAIHDYLRAHDLTGFGFCSPKNQGFYLKCGFDVADGITQRFIYRHGDQRITNQDGQIIFYLDNSTRMMRKILASPSKEVLIPADGLW